MFSAVRWKREPLMDLISFSDCYYFRCQSVALLEMVLPHFNALVGVGRCLQCLYSFCKKGNLYHFTHIALVV
jgi:hypothetical protein